jgi:hypothetical protein
MARVTDRTSGANNFGKIAALRAGAANDKLRCKSNLLMFVGNISLVGLNFVKEQLGSPVADSEPGLTD